MSNDAKLKEDEIQETSIEAIQLSEMTRKYNDISSKLFTISLIFKWLGYLSSIITCIFFILRNQIVLGLLFGLISSLSTFIITAFLDGFAEIIQLLEDIKNK